jgi:hypothetical protein
VIDPGTIRKTEIESFILQLFYYLWIVIGRSSSYYSKQNNPIGLAII